jgi:hypothetical protein
MVAAYSSCRAHGVCSGGQTRSANAQCSDTGCARRLLLSARISANAGVVQQRRRWWPKAKSLKINKGSNAGVAGSGLQNRGLQVRFLPGLFLQHEALIGGVGPRASRRRLDADPKSLSPSPHFCSTLRTRWRARSENGWPSSERTRGTIATWRDWRSRLLLACGVRSELLDRGDTEP